MKNRIIEASIELFNEMGAHRVTTNHIIARLGISPGTFYYHYRNKEEIIRAVFDRITDEFTEAVFKDSGEFTVNRFIESVSRMYRLYYRYRFFYLDLSMLLDRDPELEKKYRENYKIKSARINETVSRLEKNGIIRKFSSSAEREMLVENLWIITDFRLTFLRISSEISEEKIINDGIAGYLALLSPYIEENMAAAFKSSIKKIKAGSEKPRPLHS